MKILKKFKSLKNLNLVQFVPLIFVVSLVVNSVTGYTAPKAIETPVTKTQEVEAKSSEKSTTEKDKTASNTSDVDLSKISDGTYEGTGTGFRGQIKVSVTVKDHKITAIRVLSKQDDSAYFNRASSGVIQSILNKQSLKVDMVSGATYSSRGIIAAVKNALTGEEDNHSAAGAGGSVGTGSAKKLAKAKESGIYKDGTFIGTGKGFRGTIKVAVTIKNNKITKIKVLSKKDDNAYFNRAKSGVIARIIKKQSTNVDTVSGATYSSNGIISAVRDALKKASVKKTDSNKNKNTSTDSSKEAKLKGTYKDGTYLGTGEGFGGNLTVSVTIKDNRMTKIKVVKNEGDDKTFLDNAKGVITKMLKNQNTDVDVISGATYSSKGIIEAVKDALSKAKINNSDKKPDATTENQKPEATTEEENHASTATTEEQKTETSTEENKIKDGTYKGSATCHPDDDRDFDAYELNLEVVVKDGRITAIQNVKGSGSNYITANNGFIKDAKNKIVPQLLAGKSTSEIDMVSGATCSSKAILEAYKDAVSKIK
ncbi:MAG: FMN-binding protein [Lachnospiraceae bacterium]|nr:FMN-binding protein [Lachnospiraceae bacterium]